MIRSINRHTAFLALFSAYSIVLLAGRIWWSGSITFTFLAWNLFLAWIPLGFAALLPKGNTGRSGLMKSFFILAGWLLFLPNAPYILTDLFHLRPHRGVPVWYDLILILTFAMTGLMLGFASLRRVHTFLEMRFRPLVTWSIISLAIFASSFGIYLGRFERWNSWDIISQPKALLSNALSPFLHPFAHKEVIAMTMCFTGFLLLAYISIHWFASEKPSLKENVKQNIDG